VSAGDIITVTARSNASNLTIGSSTSSLASGTSFTATEAGYVYISATGTVYLYSIERKSVNSSSTTVTLSSEQAYVGLNSTLAITATANNSTSGSWAWMFSSGTTSDYASLTIGSSTSTSSTVTLKGLASGNVSVYAVVDGVVSSPLSITVTSASTQYISASDSSSVVTLRPFIDQLLDEQHDRDGQQHDADREVDRAAVLDRHSPVCEEAPLRDCPDAGVEIDRRHRKKEDQMKARSEREKNKARNSTTNKSKARATMTILPMLITN